LTHTGRSYWLRPDYEAPTATVVEVLLTPWRCVQSDHNAMKLHSFRRRKLNWKRLGAASINKYSIGIKAKPPLGTVYLVCGFLHGTSEPSCPVDSNVSLIRELAGLI
jgi:hypothetical protein